MQLTRQQRATLEYIADEGTCPDHHDLSRTMNLAESHDLPETVMGALSLYEDALGKETKAAEQLSDAKGHKKAMWERVRHVAKNPDGDLVDRAEKATEEDDDILPEEPKKKRGRPKKSEADELLDKSQERKREEKYDSDFAEEASTVGGIEISEEELSPYQEKLRVRARVEALRTIQLGRDWPQAMYDYKKIEEAKAGHKPLDFVVINTAFKDVEDANLEGYEDFFAGKGINPYDADDELEAPLHFAWQIGWNNGKRDQDGLDSDPEVHDIDGPVDPETGIPEQDLGAPSEEDLINAAADVAAEGEEF